MKKITAMLIAAFMILSLTACNDKAVSNENSSLDASQTNSEDLSAEASQSTSEGTESESSENVSDEEISKAENKASSEAKSENSDKAYSFSAYDTSLVTSQRRDIKTDEWQGNFSVNTVPKGMKNYVEAYKEGISVIKIKLVDIKAQGSGDDYSCVSEGSLSSDGTWISGEHFLDIGKRYDITMDEPGMWAYQIYNRDANDLKYFIFDVQE